VEQGADLIIVLGGDGTINEVASGLVGTATPLALLPGGTANCLSLETRQGTNPLRAARRLPQLRPTRIAVGCVTCADAPPRHFVSMLGAGLDAAIVDRVHLPLKRATGKFAYWVAGFQSAFRFLPQISNGTRETYGFVLASRVRNYGGDLEIAHQASLLRDDLAVVAFEGANPLRYMLYMSGVVVRAHGQLPGVSMHGADCLELRPAAGQRILVQTDGELAGALPATVTAVPDALTLLLPEEYLARERQRLPKT
jgi:diacylglycerol kinase family enzyme